MAPLLLRPSQRVYGRPTTYRDNVDCPTIKRETPKINRANKPKLGRLNKYNLDELDIKNGLGECCYRAFPDGDIYNRETELPDWDRIFEDKHPYWLERRYFSSRLLVAQYTCIHTIPIIKLEKIQKKQIKNTTFLHQF